jgi:hypothetical protein
MTPKFTGKITDGKFIPERLDGFKLWLSTLEGEIVTVVVRKPVKDRSNQQNKYYFGCLIPLLGDHIGYDAESMHQALKMLFLVDRTREPATIRSTASLSTVEFEDYTRRIREWASMELSVYLPLPNEYDF